MHPDRVGPYRIEQKLGSGGMGTVYLGRHAETDKPAAVKVLPASLAREEGFVARFNREIDAMRRLANPHVVELYESGVDDETYFYAMEYVEGETLTTRILREKRLPWREAVEIAQQICAALKGAHDAGVIHRDLKPSNLLLASDGTVKLTDFGVAQVFAGSRLTVTGGIIGTAEYMSPEQAQGTRATKKSDLYSLGAVMYAMVAGRPPFSGKTTLEVIQKHRHAQFDRPSRFAPDIPHWLDDIICQLLEKDPDKRFPDAYVVSRRLQELLRKVELSASEDTLAATQANGAGITGAMPAAAPAGPSPTLMRDLVRHEVERQHAPGALGRLFDNTWILVGLLALLVVGGVAFFKTRGTSPEALYASGVALMEQPEGEGWLRAREEYFRPLVARHPNWEEKAAPYLDQIALYEWKSDIGKKRGPRRSGAPRSEPDSILQLARHQYEIGDVAAAERTLSALAALVAGSEEHADLGRVVEALRTTLQSDRDADGDRFILVRSSLDRAEQLSKDGRFEEAARIWAGVVTLYADDPPAREFVTQARAGLAKRNDAKNEQPAEASGAAP